MSIKETHTKKSTYVNCIRECHISKEDRSTGECFIAVSGRITGPDRSKKYREQYMPG